MMSKTGWKSIGELEMTRRISPAAVYSSRLSVTWMSASVSARFFSASSLTSCILDRDDRLVGKGLQEGDFLLGEAAALTAGHTESPDRRVVMKPRHHNQASVATDSGADTRG
jgi:hypothetical protein